MMTRMHIGAIALNMIGALGRTHAPRAVLGCFVDGVPRFQFFEAIRLMPPQRQHVCYGCRDEALFSITDAG